MKWKSVTKGQKSYFHKSGSDGSMSIYSCILMYRKLMKKGKIRIGGAASKRLTLLEYRYENGDRVFRG
jgi:hypothetical protein